MLKKVLKKVLLGAQEVALKKVPDAWFLALVEVRALAQLGKLSTRSVSNSGAKSKNFDVNLTVTGGN